MPELLNMEHLKILIVVPPLFWWVDIFNTQEFRLQILVVAKILFDSFYSNIPCIYYIFFFIDSIIDELASLPLVLNMLYNSVSENTNTQTKKNAN